MIKFTLNPFTGSFDAIVSIAATAVGSSPNANAVTFDSSGTILTLQPADGTHPGVVTALAQTFGGNKTFNGSVATSSIDTASSGGTLALGTLNATTINIGNAGATVNIQGTVITEQSTTLNVTNPVFTVNSGGAAGSASNSGMQVNENSVITGYVETSADRNSWILKAPNTAGVATITPGAGGITLNQSSHNPVTIGTANGLSLSTQVLSMALANTSTTGALSGTDWTTFNNKQPAGNYITALTGDGTATGPGSVGLTLATVNLNVGSFGTASTVPSFTVNGKGLITAASAQSIQIAESQVTNLTTDLANKLTAVSVATANGLAGTSSGGATPALTLSTTVTGILKGNGTAISAATANTDYVVPNAGDIPVTSFSAANTQSAAANVTGLAFANASVRAFEAQVSVTVIATTNLYEFVNLRAIQKGSTWEMTSNSTGDASGFTFSITTAGQVQYTDLTYPGFTSATLKFRAITVPV